MTDRASRISVKNIDDKAVQDFLAQYPFLQSVIEKAEDRVLEFFGDNVEIVYRLEHDPEIAGWITLFGYIWADANLVESRKRFNDFDEQWYLDLPYEVKEKLNYHIRARRI